MNASADLTHHGLPAIGDDGIERAALSPGGCFIG